MHPKIKTLLEQAESRYLKPEEIDGFKQYAISIAQSLKAYEWLREHEIEIFQPIADDIIHAFPNTEQTVLEESLKNWLLILRHCAMAMLLNDQEYLQQNLLDWLKGIVAIHQHQEVEAKIYQLLQARLKTMMPAQTLALLQPFLDQAKATLLEPAQN